MMRLIENRESVGFSASKLVLHEPVGNKSQKINEFVNRKTGVSDDFTQRAAGDGFARMHRDDSPSPVRVSKGSMAARLPNALETKPFEYLDHLSSSDDWQSISHD